MHTQSRSIYRANWTYRSGEDLGRLKNYAMREPVSDNNAPSLPPQSLLERLKDYGQEDVFALWDELSHEERDILVKDIEVSLLSGRSFFVVEI